MNDRILEHYLEEFQAGIDVDPAEADALFDALISADNQLLLTRVLLAWDEKGTTETELFAFASIMRTRMKRLDATCDMLVDIVGTGGSSSKTFNVSTAAAFVIAGSGIAVAKHGNRAATSSSGSSDVLSVLGIDVDIDPAETKRQIDENGICFMFAPRFHSLSPTLAKARRAVGHPTIFNNLGPLCNPASAQHQVIGVWDKTLLERTAKVLARLGTKRSWIVHGNGGLDEIALNGQTTVIEIVGDSTNVFEISSADFGVQADDTAVPQNCSAEQSATLIRQILSNELNGHNAEKLVLINAAAAIYIAGQADALTEGYRQAEMSIRSGSALNKLKSFAIRN